MRGYEETTVFLRFMTPAFLGGASSGSELRSPSFKALLRCWWRLAWTKGGKPDIATMREVEGCLFGHAWLEHLGERGEAKTWANKSPIQISLVEWCEGNLKSWTETYKVRHPEVGDRGRNISADLYLGYGPLAYNNKTGRVSLTRSSAIGAGTRLTLRFRYPVNLGDLLRLDEVLMLWHALGAVGSKHRNGWGSLMVCDGLEPDRPSSIDVQRLRQFARSFEDCLSEDWCHAIGKDEKGLLIWSGKGAFKTWAEALKEIARVKIAFRTSLPLKENRDPQNPVIEERHLLAYPLTNHGVLEWSKRLKDGSPELTKKGKLQQTMRLANQLYCKVIAESESSFRPLIAHLPHRLPREMLKLLPERSRRFIEKCEESTWRQVHAILDREMQRWSVQ